MNHKYTNPLSACGDVSHGMSEEEQSFLEVYEALREASSLFDNHPSTNKEIGTFEVVNKALMIGEPRYLKLVQDHFS